MPPFEYRMPNGLVGDFVLVNVDIEKRRALYDPKVARLQEVLRFEDFNFDKVKAVAEELRHTNVVYAPVLECTIMVRSVSVMAETCDAGIHPSEEAMIDTPWLK